MNHDNRLVRRWLMVSAIAVVVAVAIGGITRLTESGLSITEWKPVSGALPPMGDEAWQSEYQRFLEIPQAQTVHAGITLGEFKWIYWWEWLHRNLARLVGLVLALPYFFLRFRGAIQPRHRLRLLSLPVLALAQGVLGWYMVSSGLAVRTSVSPYRLTAHLGMALVIYAVCVWTILQLKDDHAPAGKLTNSLRRSVQFSLVATFVTLLSGGFVAGLDAGKVFNTFPLMGGKVIPPGYLVEALGFRNLFENPVAVQFHHRVLAILTATLIVVIAAVARRSEMAPALRRATSVAGWLVLLQVGLGVSTLLLSVPILLGVLHQAMGLAVLTAVLVATFHARESEARG